MGSSWYQKRYFPLNMGELRLEEMTDVIVGDVVTGVADTGIRSGIIGEVGINGNPLTENEVKLTRASARASRLTGAPLSFHLGGIGEEKFRTLELVASEGVEMSSVIMGHCRPMAVDHAFAHRILGLGVYIEFDWIGTPGSPGGYIGPLHDRKIAQGMAHLIKEGYVNQILLSHDICTKIQYRKYGGLGYTYIHRYFLPALRDMGVSDEDIHKIMVENPARALTFVKPQVPQ
jgi:phosphotriesterase-related protein